MPPKFYSKSKRYFSNTYAQQPNKKDNRITVTFLLIGLNKIGVEIPYKAINTDSQLKNIIKNNQGIWDRDERIWVLLGMKNYHKVLDQMTEHCKKKQYYCNKIPSSIFDAVLDLPLQLLVKISRKDDPPLLKYLQTETYMDPQTLPFFDRLYDFQKQCLLFGIEHHGRFLLADQMGIGKTIQSLAIAFMYRYQWPMIVICPSTLRFNWYNQIFNWYGNHIKKNQVQVYTKGGTTLRDTTKILIISYDLAWKFKQLWMDFKVAIADQAHFLKNSGCKRTDILVPQLAKKKRIILLTGTPAFARPREIYNLISIIRPDAFHNFTQFGNRYCQPMRNPWSGGMEYNGCKNAKQLFFILKDRVMLRRLKKDVLTQLPDKQRQKIMIETNKNITKEINALIDQNGSNPMNKPEDIIMEMFGFRNESFGTHGDRQNRKRQDIMEAYRLSGAAKVQGVVEYILQLLENDVKLLIFAHHHTIIDRIQTQLRTHKFKSIRIDGAVQMSQRQNRVDAFQNNRDIMAALLSITAAGMGLTLTASSTVVFAQLHWTPGMMIQAQDRAHRIGQKNCVNCHYLIGEGTLDNILYNYLLKKISNVSTFVDGSQQHLQIEQLHKGQIGKVSKSVLKSQNKEQRDKYYGEDRRRLSGRYMITPIRQVIDIRVSPKGEEKDSDISQEMNNNPFTGNQTKIEQKFSPKNLYRKNSIQTSDEETESVQQSFTQSQKKIPQISDQQYTDEQIKNHIDFINRNKIRVYTGKISIEQKSSEQGDSLRTSEMIKLIDSECKIRKTMEDSQIFRTSQQNNNIIHYPQQDSQNFPKTQTYPQTTISNLYGNKIQNTQYNTQLPTNSKTIKPKTPTLSNSFPESHPQPNYQ